MQCSKCGTPLEEGTLFCPQCGAVTEVELTVRQAPVSEEIPELHTAAEVPSQVSEAPAEKRWKMLWYGITAVLVIAMVVVVISLVPRPYTSALDTYVEFMYGGKVSKMNSLAPREYWADLREDGYMSMDKKRLTASALGNEYHILSTFGEDATITYEVTKQNPVKDGRMDEIRVYLNQEYEIRPEAVKEGYIIEYHLVLTSPTYTDDWEEQRNYVLRIGNRWYLAKGLGDGELGIMFLVDMERRVSSFY